MDQQRGIDLFRIRLSQQFEFVPQFREQFLGSRRRGDRVANLPLDVDGLGERAQVEPDHRPLEPALRRRDDGGGGRRIVEGGQDIAHGWETGRGFALATLREPARDCDQNRRRGTVGALVLSLPPITKARRRRYRPARRAEVAFILQSLPAGQKVGNPIFRRPRPLARRCTGCGRRARSPRLHRESGSARRARLRRHSASRVAVRRAKGTATRRCADRMRRPGRADGLLSSR